MCGFLLSSSSSYWPGFHENSCLLNGCEIILHRFCCLRIGSKWCPREINPATRNAKRLSCKVGSALRFHHHLHGILQNTSLRSNCTGKLFNFFLSPIKHRKNLPFLVKKTRKKLQTLPSDSCHITVCPVESMLTTLTRSTKLPVSLFHAEKTPAVSQHTETMGIPWQGGPAA